MLIYCTFFVVANKYLLTYLLLIVIFVAVGNKSPWQQRDVSISQPRFGTEVTDLKSGFCVWLQGKIIYHVNSTKVSISAISRHRKLKFGI